jgi:hypothetical protein
VLLAVVVLAIAGAGESMLILRLSSYPRTRTRILRGTLLLLAGAALCLAWRTLLDRQHGNDFLVAGYLNSRFPHSLRNIFSYEHILLLMGWGWTALGWTGAGVIAIFVFAGTASARPFRAIGYTSRSVAYWAAVVFGTTCATWLTGSMIQWTPGHGLRVEMVSLILRLTFAVLVDAAVVCLVLAILAACIRQSDALYETPAGTPDDSQPRTVDNP